MEEIRKFGFKIAVIGDNQVGKTFLLKKFTQSTFDKEYDKTIGFHTSIFNRKYEGM